jgi:hypothetical protein
MSTTDHSPAVESAQPVNLRSASVVRASNVTSIFLNRVARPRASITSLGGAIMSEPASSAAGGIALWKVAGSILGIGVVASALGFLVLLPKTPKEAAFRALATMAGSALLGPLVVAAAYSRYPEVFSAGATIAQSIGMEPWLGMFMVAAPLLAMAGLPFWWVLGAGVLWFERRKGKDLGELAADVKAIVP